MDQPQWVSRAQAVTRRVIFEGRIGKVVDYFGGASPFAGPQAYLVEQRDYVTRPHFHPSDQFQVLYGSPGSALGRHPLGGLTVHYADAFTVYGPLIGGDPPLRYFTLRAEPTAATEFMPESRDKLTGHRGGRSLHSDLGPWITQSQSQSQSQSQQAVTTASAVFDDARDGLEVSYLTAAEGERIELPPAGLSGQFVFVVTGAVVSDGHHYAPESIGWLPPGATHCAVTAGEAGAGLLVLRYPAPAGAGRDEAPDA